MRNGSQYRARTLYRWTMETFQPTAEDATDAQRNLVNAANMFLGEVKSQEGRIEAVLDCGGIIRITVEHFHPLGSNPHSRHDD